MSTLQNVISTSSLNASVLLVDPMAAGIALALNALNPAVKTYNSTSTPVGTYYIGDEATLSGSAATSDTIDLTDLTDNEGIAVDGTDAKVQEIRIQAGDDNAGTITVSDGDSNAYSIFGSGNEVDLKAGEFVHRRCNDQLADISASAKDIKISGTGGDTYSYDIVIG